MHKFICSAALLFVGAAMMAAEPSPDAVRLAKVVAPFVTTDTILIAHLDADVDLASAFDAAIADVNLDQDQKKSAREALAPIVGPQKDLVRSGVVELVLVLGAKLNAGGMPEGRPQITLLIRKSAHAKADDVVKQFKDIMPLTFDSLFGKTWAVADWIAMAPEDPQAESKKNRLRPVKELSDVFGRMLSDGKGLHVAFLPQSEIYKSLSDNFSVTRAEEQLSESDSPRHDGLVFAMALAGKRTTLSVVGGPKPKIVCQADATDDEAAKKLLEAISTCIQETTEISIREEPVRVFLRMVGERAKRETEGKIAKVTLDVSDGTLGKALESGLSALFPTRAVLARERLKTLGTALLQREELYGGYMPVQLKIRDDGPIPEYAGKSSYSWRVLLLLYTEASMTYDRMDFAEGPDGPNNSRVLKAMPEVLRHPQFPDDPLDTCRYAVPLLPGGGFEGGPMVQWGVTKKDIVDGPENTIAIVVLDKPVPYKLGDNWNVDLNDPTKGLLIQDGKITVVLFDGSVVDLDASDKETIRSMLTIAGGEKIERK